FTNPRGLAGGTHCPSPGKLNVSLTPAASPSSGLRLVAGYLDRAAQARLLAAVRAVIEAAPLFVPRMPRTGKPFSVRMTNCGPLGWVSDEAGYRYQELHPQTGAPWPAIPDLALAAWRELAEHARSEEHTSELQSH